jgi:SNF2 family DNA or RNA helicase
MKGKFALTLTVHRILGPVFNPVIIAPSANREFYTVQDRLSPANLRQYEHQLQPEETALVKVIEEYSDTQLLKVYSKKKMSARDLLSSVDEKMYDQQVRPYIERRLLRCIELFSGTEIPVYMKKLHNNIYETDRLLLQEDTAGVVFNFIRNNEGIQYHLTISYNDELISLTGKNGFILTNDPCSLVLENRIFQFDDIDGKKLLPFFKKKTILIRPETERKFLETFAKPVIRKYRVNAQGFTITDRMLKPHPVLSLESSITGIPAFILRFRYGEKVVYPAGKKSELLVTMSESEKGIDFTRLSRNYDDENHIISSLLEQGLANIDASSFVPLRTKKAENIFLTYDLVSWLNAKNSTLNDLGIEVVQTNPAKHYYLRQLDLNLEVRENRNDWFDIFAVVHFDGFTIPFVKFRTCILNGRREYELPEGSVLVLPEEWFARFKDLFAFAKEENEQLVLDKQHFPLLKESLKGIDDIYKGRLKKWFDLITDEQQEVPSEIRADLRDYQKKGFNWMLRLYDHDFGGCLADDMGLGKTLQTLALIRHVINSEKKRCCGPSISRYEKQLTIFDSVNAAQSKVKPSLIIVPVTLVHNWLNESLKFDPELKIGFYGGQNRKPFNYYYDHFEVIITSYGLIRNDLDTLKIFDFLYVILDESQVIKNPHSKTYKALIQLNTAHRIVLTGTPIENSLTDLWAQMNFLNPGLLGNYEFFKNQFVTPIEKTGSEKQTHILQTLISPFVLRRTKSDVALELPPLSQQVLYCDMSESQHAFYETEKSKARNLILDNIRLQGIEKSSFVILQSLTKLRQAANHPVLIDPEYNEDSGKHDVIIDNINNLVAEGHKALIFSSFVKHLNLYTHYCDSINLSYSLLTGEVLQHQREAIIRKFQNDPEVHLFFISLKAGGFGLNLISADYVFILDPWWNPAVEEQAMGRAHRIGQKKNVFVYRFISKDTLEEKIHHLQERKSRLAENFINANRPLMAGDKEDILKLLE